MAESTKDFGNRIFKQLDEAVLIIGISTGCKLGLFEVMAKFDEPKSSEDIASAAKYRERYVREWLNLMVAGCVVDVDPEGVLYFLPLGRRPALVGKTPQSSVVHITKFLPMFGAAEDQVLKAFKPDGPRGTTYDMYPGIYKTMNDARVAEFTPEKFSPLYNNYPELKADFDNGVSICEIGCGQGFISIYFAETFPKSTITAVDIGDSPISSLKQTAHNKGLQNLEAIVHDACHLPANWTNTFRYIFVYDTIHDVPNATKCIENLYRILSPGGYISVLESACFSNPYLNAGVEGSCFNYGASLYHCLPVSSNTPGSEALGTSWGKEKCKTALEQAGFKDYNVIAENSFDYHIVLRK